MTRKELLNLLNRPVDHNLVVTEERLRSSFLNIDVVLRLLHRDFDVNMRIVSASMNGTGVLICLEIDFLNDDGNVLLTVSGVASGGLTGNETTLGHDGKPLKLTGGASSMLDGGKVYSMAIKNALRQFPFFGSELNKPDSLTGLIENEAGSDVWGGLIGLFDAEDLLRQTQISNINNIDSLRSNCSKNDSWAKWLVNLSIDKFVDEDKKANAKQRIETGDRSYVNQIAVLLANKYK